MARLSHSLVFFAIIVSSLVEVSSGAGAPCLFMNVGFPDKACVSALPLFRNVCMAFLSDFRQGLSWIRHAGDESSIFRDKAWHKRPRT